MMMIKTCRKLKMRMKGGLKYYNRGVNRFGGIGDNSLTARFQARRCFSDIRARIEEERKRRLLIMEEALPVETSKSKAKILKIRY